MRDDSLGVYLHVPFCERICPYCDFAVVRARRLSAADEAEYVDALLQELAVRRGGFAGLQLETIYLGGGTPSLLQPESVARLLRAVRDAFPSAAPLETTLEMNPGTTERARLPGFRAAGVDRLSIGIQSFDDGLLRRLGRAHRAEEGRRSVAAARDAGFGNVSLDLILGAPGAARGVLHSDLEEALALAPEHLSGYALTIEAGTPFALAASRGQLALPEEDEVARMLEETTARLEAAGLRQYEISSFARPGFESRHNRRYWQRQPVLGLGVGAWSSEPPSAAAPHGARRANVRELPVYLERVRSAGSAEAGPAEVLEPHVARGEAMFLALRTREGLDAGRFAQEFGAPPRSFFAAALDELEAAALLEEGEGGALRLTPRGRLLSDSVFERFV